MLVQNVLTKRNDYRMTRVVSQMRDGDRLGSFVSLQLPPLKGSSRIRSQIRSIHVLALIVPSNDLVGDCSSSAS